MEEKDRKILIILIIILLIMISEDDPSYNIVGRKMIGFIERKTIEEKMIALSDNRFQRMFRLPKNVFYQLASSVKDYLKIKTCSYRGVGENIQLAVCLRYLAGGSYLDICFGYDVPEGSFYDIIHNVIVAILNILPDINFSFDENDLRQNENGFNKLSNGLFPGTVAAGDGVVFSINRPTIEAVEGDVSSQYTRKGLVSFTNFVIINFV